MNVFISFHKHSEGAESADDMKILSPILILKQFW